MCELTDGALNTLIQIIDKDIKQNCTQYRAFGDSTFTAARCEQKR